MLITVYNTIVNTYHMICYRKERKKKKSLIIRIININTYL